MWHTWHSGTEQWHVARARARGHGHGHGPRPACCVCCVLLRPACTTTTVHVCTRRTGTPHPHPAPRDPDPAPHPGSRHQAPIPPTHNTPRGAGGGGPHTTGHHRKPEAGRALAPAPCVLSSRVAPRGTTSATTTSSQEQQPPATSHQWPPAPPGTSGTAAPGAVRGPVPQSACLWPLALAVPLRTKAEGSPPSPPSPRNASTQQTPLLLYLSHVPLPLHWWWHAPETMATATASMDTGRTGAGTAARAAEWRTYARSG